MSERKTIMKLSATVPASEQKYVRWMRLYGISVFVAKPVYTKQDGHWYQPWVALGTNIFIDPVQCDVGAFPTE